MTVSSLHAMAKDPECNHRLSEYAWYSIWTAILVDLAAGMHARAPHLHIFFPAPQFCLWARRTPRPVVPQPALEHNEASASQSPPPPAVQIDEMVPANPPFSPSPDETALESISANGDERRDNPSSTRSTDEAEPREFRLPDISLLGMISTFRRGRARVALHERNITKFRIPIILEIKPEVGPEVGLEFGADRAEAQSEVADQAKYLFAAYEQNVVIGIAAVGLTFRYAIFRRKRGSPSTASELRDPDYIDNLDNSEEWSPRETFGKRRFSSIFKTIVQIAFEEVLDLPFVE